MGVEFGVVAHHFGDYPSSTQHLLEAIKLANVVEEQVQRVCGTSAGRECLAPLPKDFSGFIALSSGVKENERNTVPGPLDDLFDLLRIPLAGLALSKRVDIRASFSCPVATRTLVSMPASSMR